jgi:hypothetical protein
MEWRSPQKVVGAHVERSFFHLDGPEATRHLDTLLDIPDLDGIQWEPGAGNGSQDRLQWMDKLKKIQLSGKSLWVACRVTEAKTMLSELWPKGLILSILDCDSLETVREIERFAKSCPKA